MSKSKKIPSIEDVKHLQIPLQEIKLATNNFAREHVIGKGGFGVVYKGKSVKHGDIAVKCLDPGYGQGDREFKMEIALLSKYKHENIVSLIGFCDHAGEKMLVYKFENNGSLDKHLNNKDLTWIRRIQICLDAAQGLNYVHVGSQQQIFHRDVKSPNILLDDNWKAKISDFGLSREGSMLSFAISNPCGTHNYMDPDYVKNGIVTLKTDVYSFGVVLWEVLCGRLAHDTSYKDNLPCFTKLVEKHYNRKTLDRIIPPYLHNQINPVSFDIFTKTAYQCLKNAEERPTMKQVVEQLQLALQQAGENPVEGTVATRDQINKENLNDQPSPPPPPPLPQEIVLRVNMHCAECARSVRQCLKGLKGVEGVTTNCEKRMVIVKGENADPIKVLERIKEKTGRQVELLSPIPKPPVKKPPQVKKKDIEPLPVIFEAPMELEASAGEIETNIKEMNGVKGEVVDYDKTEDNTVIVNQDPTLKQTKPEEITKTEPSDDITDNTTTTTGDDANPNPLEEDQNLVFLLLVLKIFVFCIFLACKFVIFLLCYSGQFVCRRLLQIYDISNPQSVDQSPPHASLINKEVPQQSLAEDKLLVK